MKTSSYPDTVVIGRIVVCTRDRFLAREIERLVEQEGLPDRMSDGMIRFDGETTRWIALPSAKAENSTRSATATT